jgi:hypothetical protein
MQKSARKLDQWARSWLRARAAPGRWSGALESVLVERHGTILGREGVFALQSHIILTLMTLHKLYLRVNSPILSTLLNKD